MSNSLRPLHLEQGDTIGIVAPAWSFDPDKFRKGTDKLKRLGFKVKYDRRIFNKYWGMAGHDKERAEQINQMFADRNIKAIFCAKAGYGSMRTIPYLDRNVIRRNPKIFIGYSDITILLHYLQKVVGMVVFHGPVVSGEIHDAMNPKTLEYLFKAIASTKPLGELCPPTLKALRPGRASGVLTGGNMSLIMSAIGTDYDFSTDNSIFFLEDIGEDLEVIDNYLMQLKLAGKLKRIRGIVFGRMHDCKDGSGRLYTIKDILNDILGDIRVPILYGFPSGHRDPGEVNFTLPLGVRVTIDSRIPSVRIDEAGVV